MMSSKKIISVASASLITTFVIGFTAVVTGINISALATYQDRQPYMNSITFTASDFSNGSGSIVKNGNTFTYTEVSVNGDVVTIGVNGVISSTSGASEGADLSGAGFSKIAMVAGSNFTSNITLNGNSIPLEMDADEVGELPVNSRQFEFRVVSAPITAKSFTVSYECKSSSITMDGYANESIWDTEVMSKPVVVGSSDDYTTKIYAVKKLEGLYVYAEQHVLTKKNVGNSWFEHDNLEFRFGNQNGTLFVDRRQDSKAFIDQIWLSSLKTSNISAGNYAVTDFVENPNGGFDVNYECFLSWSELTNFKYDLRYEDSIIFVAGVSYCDAGGWKTTRTWSNERPNLTNYDEIRATGIEPFAYENVNTGGSEIEGVNKNKFDSDSYFNLGCQTVTMNGNHSWSLSFECTSIANNPNAAGDGASFEICSPNWSNGGWSVRKDWWAWGGWNNNGGEGNAGPNDNSEITGSWENAIANCTIKGRISFNEYSGFFMFAATYTSHYEGYEGKNVYVSFFSKMIDYRGETQVKFGASYGSIQISSLKLVTGALAA